MHRYWAVICSGFILAACLGVLIFNQPDEVAVLTGAGIPAQVYFTVLDGRTQQPLAHARVILPEYDLTLTSDEQGRTAVSSVEVLRNDYYNRTLPQIFGQITVLCYKDGYLPYALFGLNVYSGETRTLEILMFTPDNAPSTDAIVLQEGFAPDWVKQFIDKYQPKLPTR